MSEHRSVTDRLVVLCGHAPIHEFVRFVRTRATNGQQLDELALTDEWRKSSGRLEQLRQSERPPAEGVELTSLPESIAARAEEAIRTGPARKSLGFLPHRWAMVELDRLVVWQKYVNLEFSDLLRQSLPSHPSAEDLLRVAMGEQQVPPPLSVTTLSSNSYSFSSSSTDIRVLGAVPLDPANVYGHEPYGRAAAVLAVYIGYSLNFMWAIQMGNRILLVNGTHRAHALRAHGVIHTPCVVSRVSSLSDLELVGLPQSADSTSSYLSRDRPPLLRDYFTDGLRKEIVAARDQHIIQLELNFERTRSPVYVR